MEEKIPRRMMRFYRNAQKGLYSNERIYDLGGEKENELLSPSGRKILPQIPSMNYEDLKLIMDEKNLSDLEKINEKKIEEQLAFEEVNRFKEKNNRLPNKEESNMIAENIFNQLKGANLEELYKETEKQNQVLQRNFQLRRGRHNSVEDKSSEEKIVSSDSTASSQTLQKGSELVQKKEWNSQENELNQIVSKSKGEKETTKKDDFDLDLEGLNAGSVQENDELEPLEEVPAEIDDTEQCPNCKRETDKIIYCPNCGFAFCSKCSKKQGDKFICPKCGALINA